MGSKGYNQEPLLKKYNDPGGNWHPARGFTSQNVKNNMKFHQLALSIRFWKVFPKPEPPVYHPNSIIYPAIVFFFTFSRGWNTIRPKKHRLQCRTQNLSPDTKGRGGAVFWVLPGTQALRKITKGMTTNKLFGVYKYKAHA